MHIKLVLHNIVRFCEQYWNDLVCRYTHTRLASITKAKKAGILASSAGTGMQSAGASSAGALGMGIVSTGASATVSKKDIWRGCVESSGFGFGWMAGFSFLDPF